MIRGHLDVLAYLARLELVISDIEEEDIALIKQVNAKTEEILNRIKFKEFEDNNE